jgi:hypothetical protein
LICFAHFDSLKLTRDFILLPSSVPTIRSTTTFIEKSINRLASFTNLLADDGKADQRRTIGSALPLDSIRRLIQRAVIRFLYAANG